MSPQEIGCVAERPLKWWRDIWHYQPVVLRAVKTSPVAIAWLLISAVIGSVSNNIDRLLSIPDCIATMCLTCTVIAETWSELTNSPRQDHQQDLRPLMSAIGANWLYSLFVVLGGVLLVVPGIYVMISANLAIVYVCVEKKRALPALESSRTLVKGHFNQAFAYLMPPALIGTGGGFALLMLLAMIAGFVVGEDSSIDNVIGSLGGMAISWLILSIVPLQVRLYKHLKEEKGELQRLVKTHAQ